MSNKENAKDIQMKNVVSNRTIYLLVLIPTILVAFITLLIWPNIRPTINRGPCAMAINCKQHSTDENMVICEWRSGIEEPCLIYCPRDPESEHEAYQARPDIEKCFSSRIGEDQESTEE